ncbi:MAG: carboxypeptidase regulatory-like domain-containing protein [Acidobacteriia bacterium]|nr:carboxypeptidase regulatory-like domain-containing protein [Terriglobia bacterium]
MRRTQGILAGLVVGLWLCMTVVAVAQSDRGTIAGSVLDSSGAAVPGASITVKGADTGTVYKTVSTAEGVYRVSDVAIGRYDITVEAQGFKTSQQKGVPVQINTVAALNITLQPGDVKEEVTVQADAPTLQTESSDVGTIVDTKQILELPLALSATGQSFLRSPESFVFLTPGTTGPGSGGSSSGVFESKLAGGQNFGTEVLLDGASVQRQDVVSAFDQTAPSVEALSEFKVTTATPSAQYGRTSGGIESFTTKSGTNRYHGTVFELFRNEALDANGWLFNYQNGLNMLGGAPPTHKLRDRQNDFGGSLGGPVRIPHLYDGHDKTFFFFSWEQYRNKVGVTSTTTVPTADERAGNFSAILGPGLVDGNDNPIINPCDGQQVRENQIFDPSTTDPNNGNCRFPFPNNTINTPLSTVAQNVLKYVPLPNKAADANGNNNFIFNAQLPYITTTMSFRIDENLTEKSKLFFSYSSRESSQLQSTPSLPFPVDPGNYHNNYFTHYTRLGWDYIASPSLLNHVTVGLNRVWTASLGESVNGSNWNQILGLSGASGQTFPQFNFSGGISSYTQLSGGNDDRHIPNSLVVADSVSWMRGRHSVKFGGEWRAYQFSVLNLANNSGSYQFSNAQTAFAPGVGEQSNGDPFAAFMLGVPSNENLQLFTHFPRWVQNYYALYVQDDFKFRRNLTVNLGLRWDVDTPRHEAQGFQSALSLTASNPGTPGQPGAFVYGNQAIGAKTYYKNFGPRIGFAYSPDFLKNTVFRGGYSIYYAALSYADFGNNFTVGTTANPSFSSPDNFTPIQSLDQGFMAYTPPSTNRDPTILNFQTGTNNYIAPDSGRPGMVQNWNVEVQHQIAQDLILSIGYVGQHATRLHSWLGQVNAIFPQYLSLGASLGDSVTSPEGQAVLNQIGVTAPSWFAPGWGGAASVGQLLRPFPQFGNINTTDGLENLGQSTYHALQAKVERRFRNGLNLLAAYTFSKTLTDADSNYPSFTGNQSNVFGAQNPFNLRAEKQVSYQDIPQTLVLSYMYELPVGPGKKYLNHGIASHVLGGWQISGVQRYQSGSPMFISEFAYNPGNLSGQLSTGNFRYSLLPGQPLFVSNPAHWTPSLGANGYYSTCIENNDGTFGFAPGNNAQIVNCPALIDPSAVSIAAGGGFVYGNLPTTFSNWRSPGYVNEDFAIIKRTTIRENHVILFKLDIPNAFNRHRFGAGGGAPQNWNPTFGTPGFTFYGAPNGGVNAARQIQATLRYEF